MPEASRVRPAHLVVPDLGVGLGLRAPHYQEILQGERPIGFFEAISENFMSGARKPLYFLDRIRERYPVVLHGVSLSIGGPDELDREYLKQLKALVDRIDPPWVTDHFCFSSAHGSHVHDLLPLPYTSEMVRRVAERARQVQDYLERPFGLENTSSYLAYTRSEMTEWQFVSEVVEAANIGLLFDVNNVYVSAYNHQFDPLDFVSSVPHERILQIHMAGHTNHGTHIIDTHSGPCLAEVLELYERAIRLAGPVSTLVEWDDEIPPLEIVVQEAERIGKSRALGAQTRPTADTRPKESKAPPLIPSIRAIHPETLSETQIGVAASTENPMPLTSLSEELRAAESRFTGSRRLSPLEQIEIYRDQFWLRHLGSLREDFPGLLGLMGDDAFEDLARAYLTDRPRPDFSLRTLGCELPSFVRSQMPGSETLVAMAELEWAYIHAFDAKDSAAVPLEELMKHSAEEWAQARFSLSPSVTLLAMPLGTADLRRAILKGKAPEPNPPENGREHRIVYRHSDLGLYDKELVKLAFELLRELAKGTPFGRACENVSEGASGTDSVLEQNLVPWLREWTELGFLSSIKR